MGFVTAEGITLYYEETGGGVPVLLIHPAGATASTWDSVATEVARAGRVVVYDRRGYRRTGGEAVRSIPTHTADAAALLDALHTPPAVVVGASVGATIAIDLARRRPDLVRAVVAYESPWRALHHLPTAPGVAALARTMWLGWRGRHRDAAEGFLRWAYTYRDGGTAWDVMPESWRDDARENAKSVLADIRVAIGGYPPAKDLATINTPVVCSYGSRSSDTMVRITRSLARAIPTATVRPIERAGHAVAFDAPATFAQVIIESVRT